MLHTPEQLNSACIDDAYHKRPGGHGQAGCISRAIALKPDGNNQFAGRTGALYRPRVSAFTKRRCRCPQDMAFQRHSRKRIQQARGRMRKRRFSRHSCEAGIQWASGFSRKTGTGSEMTRLTNPLCGALSAIAQFEFRRSATIPRTAIPGEQHKDLHYLGGRRDRHRHILRRCARLFGMGAPGPRGNAGLETGGARAQQEPYHCAALRTCSRP